VSAVRQAPSRKAREGAHPQLFRAMLKDKPALYFPDKVGQPPKRPDDCMGFALYRIDLHGTETALPSHAVFKGDVIKKGQTSAEFPVQKFYWKDPYARLVGEQIQSFTFRYKMPAGKRGGLKASAVACSV
jgi:hypothetical protein